MWCGVVWCGVVWCGVVWCGVVWCGVVWCGASYRVCDVAELDQLGNRTSRNARRLNQVASRCGGRCALGAPSSAVAPAGRRLPSGRANRTRFRQSGCAGAQQWAPADPDFLSHESRVTSHESRVTSHESERGRPPPATGMGFAASCWLQAGGSHSCSEQARRPTSDAGLPSRVPSRVSGIRYQGRCLRHKINQVPILDSVANKRQGTPKDQRQWQPIRVRAPRY